MGLVFAAMISAIWFITLVSCLSINLESLKLASLISLVLLRSFIQTGLFIVGHDAMHENLAPKSPKLNHYIGSTALILYAGLNYRLCKRNHILHHLKAESENDPVILEGEGEGEGEGEAEAEGGGGGGEGR